jgi:predicted nucleic acid-binding protein
VIVVDTSIWIGHFRSRSAALSSLLEAEEVMMHPFVVGELACGNLKNRQEIIALLQALPRSTKADDNEVLAVTDRHRLMGRGLGLIDVHLLASCLIDGCQLWTDDKPLKTAAAVLGINGRRVG